MSLQGNISIGANEQMEIGGFLQSGSDPIDVESYPPRLTPRVLQKGSKFESTIKIGGNASVNQGNKIRGIRGKDIEQEGSEFVGYIEGGDGAKLTQGNEIDREKVKDRRADEDAKE